MKYIIFILSVLLTSCMTSQKAMSYLEAKGELPKICADKFPVRDSIIVKDSVTLDTVYVGSDPVFDTVTQTVNDTVVRVVTKTLPAKVITKTQVQVKEVYRENTARVVALQNEIKALVKRDQEWQTAANLAKDKLIELKENSDQWKKKARQRWWWIVGLIVFAFRRMLIGGIGRLVKHWAG